MTDVWGHADAAMGQCDEPPVEIQVRGEDVVVSIWHQVRVRVSLSGPMTVDAAVRAASTLGAAWLTTTRKQRQS